MPYSAILYSELIDALSLRLSDQAHEFWSENELKSYLTEALRTWQVFSATYNKRVVVPTVANQLFYNLFSLVPELTPTVTDAEIARDIAFVLQEPFNSSSMTWIGTLQFTAANVYQAIQQRRDKFFLETGIVLTPSEISGPAPGTATVNLAENVIDVRHALWKDSNNVYSQLWRLDPHTVASSPFLNQSVGTPLHYLTYPLQPLVMEVVPPTANAGTVNLLTVNSGADLNPSSPTILGIPDDLCWVIKFGALADLLATDGPGQDIERSVYCQSRWREGVALARITNFVHIGQNNGVPWYIDSLAELNSGDPLWMSRTPGQPSTLAVAGNMVATGPVADGVYSMAFDIMPKFPVPTALSLPVQIGPEVVNAIIDYAQHLANIKEGASEIQADMPLYENLVKLAAVQNDRLRAQSQNFDVLNSRSNRFKKEHPRRVSTLKTKELDYAND